MRQLWTSLNYKIRHQVYLRVLPVLALSILLVGAVGWVVFTRAVIGNRALVGGQNLQDQVDDITLKMVKETLSQETRLASFHAGGQVSDGFLRETLGQTSLVVGLGLIDQQAEGGPRSTGMYLKESLAGYFGEADLAAWIQGNRRFLAVDYRPGSWEGVRERSAPYQAENIAGHPIYIFAPIFAQNDLNTEVLPLVPVLVRGDGKRDRVHTLYLFQQGALPHPDKPGQWTCLLDDSGRVLQAPGGSPPAGTLLKDQKIIPGHPVLAAVGGGQLLDSLQGGGRASQGHIGGGLVPWLVLRQESPELGLTVLMVDRVTDLKASVTHYLWLLLLAVALALSGAIFGINRVMHQISDQLAILAQNMEALARGDYSGRMPQRTRDEIGALIGYFNLMAVSLDEAHRQVKEKAAHLRAALENMRLLDKAKDDFMILISHEVRTPLTAIMGGVDYLKKAVEQVSGEDREVLDRLNVEEITRIIRSSGDRLSGFMTDAIQMTSMGSANARLDLQPVPVSHMVDLGLCGVAELASQKQVLIHNLLDASAGWSVLCDHDVLRVAFEKVLKNAVVHNRPGGAVIIREAMTVPGRGPIWDLIGPESLRRLEEQQTFEDYEDEDLRWRLVEIFNTGQPIPADRRAALFGKFELVGPIENHQKGSGLSLPIAKAAAESHGGRIFLHSDGQDGNSFFLLLPTLDDRLEPRPEKRKWSRKERDKGFGRAAWDEEVSQARDSTPFNIELDDLCTTILGGIDEPGGGVDDSSCADNQEEIAIGRRGE